MTLWKLAVRGLRFHRRAYLAVLFGAALAAAVLTGALAVGDSVRYSLRRMALARLGDIQLSLHNPGRFFREALAGEVAGEIGAPVAPVLLLRGTATAGQRADGTGGDLRAGRVQVVGVTDDFWRMGGVGSPTLTSKDAAGEGVALNDTLARTLGVRVGEEVLLRVDKPSLLSRDAPLSTLEEATVTLRLPVTAVLTDRKFGRFSLDANQVPPYNAFVALPTLQRAVGMEDRGNTLLVGSRKDGGSAPVPSEATGALWKRWQFDDAGLVLRPVRSPAAKGALELRTTRVFLEPPIAEAALTAQPGARGVLTYFVNELRVGNRAAPYSTVAALAPGSAPLPPGMADDEAVINQWLADDIGAKPGDTLKLTYWLVGPMRRLEQRTSDFRIRAVLPMNGPANDPDLMPDIPGLSDKKDCRDWEPGVPVDLDKIRDKDQAYWSTYRGSPKAFLTLRAGRQIWNNRFGDLTSVRYPGSGTAAGQATVEACIRQALNPASLGLFFQPVRERALAAGAQGIDFGQLFLGLSFFLIVAGLLLTALLFAFAVENRAEEMGLLLALGLPARRVRALLLWEGAMVALLAALLGAGLATLYTRAVVYALSSVWSGAVANSSLEYHAEPATLAGGALASFLLALMAILLVARRQAGAPARELLASGAESGSRLLAAPSRKRGLLPGLPTALVAGGLALALVISAAVRPAETATASAGAFFGAGALLLIAGIAACRALLAHRERRAGGESDRLSVSGLGVRNASRRTGRSLGAVTLLACGTFLVVAVGANRHDPAEGAQRPSSGTGGFALYGESSLPVYQDLNAPDGRDQFALDPDALAGTEVVALRLREGDEASCLNLNRAQTPRLVGVPPAAFARRRAFTFEQVVEGGGDDPWRLIGRPEADGAIPVVGDTNTVVWALGKKLGDTFPYTDDRGVVHKLRIVGVLGNSVLQGALVLSEDNFTRLFPGQSGYQVFLVTAPDAARADAARRELTRGLEDVGMSLIPAAERLAAFSTVENTYLSIFAALGGLGLLLGSAGLGVIVLRNVWDRRGELALLRAVGWGRPALHRLVFGEHALLLGLGLTVGVAAALVAVLPVVLPALLRSSGADVPVVSLGLTLLAVLLSGFAWVWAATTVALRAPLLAALRSE